MAVAPDLDLETLDVRFVRPDGFDLWTYWHQRTQELTDALYQAEATVRFSPRALELAPVRLSPDTARALAEGAWPTDEDGWVRAVIQIESIAHARGELLALGADVEVLGPPALREQMIDTAHALAALYP